MKSIFVRHILILAFILVPFGIIAQDNNKILNRPYADMKPIHFGFSVGFHTQDLQFTHNGYVTENGEAWFMEVPNFSPGFNVTVLADWRLGKHFNLRLTPGMYFGNKVIAMYDVTNKIEDKQNVKTNYVVMPLELKVSAERYKNLRPYVLGGVMAAFDVSKKKSENLMFKGSDFMLTIGFGCDFYLPYFKFSPEVKFCFGLADILKHDRPDLSDDPQMMKYTNSLTKATQQMVVFSFFFE